MAQKQRQLNYTNTRLDRNRVRTSIAMRVHVHEMLKIDKQQIIAKYVVHYICTENMFQI